MDFKLRDIIHIPLTLRVEHWRNLPYLRRILNPLSTVRAQDGAGDQGQDPGGDECTVEKQDEKVIQSHTNRERPANASLSLFSGGLFT